MTGPHVKQADTDWRQVGSIHGEKYNVWFRCLNGNYLCVSKGEVTGRWYKTVNCSNRGSVKKFETAKAHCEREANGKGDAW